MSDKFKVWKDVVGYEGYYKVSNFGTVKRVSTNNEWTPIVNRKGYLKVNLYVSGIRKTKEIHKMVAQAFLGHKPCGYGEVVNHIDHNTTNNKLSNLELISQRQNCSHRKKIGSSKYTGVTLESGKWRAKIFIDGKSIHLGVFEKEIDASNAYQDKLKTIL